MLIDRFQEYVREHELFTKQDKILLTVSGGVDIPVPDIPPFDIGDIPKREDVAPVKKEAPKKEAPQPKKVQAGAEFTLVINKIRQADIALYMQLRYLDGGIENDKFVFYLPENAQTKEALILKQAPVISGYIKDVLGKDLNVIVKYGKKETKEAENPNLSAAFDLFS